MADPANAAETAIKPFLDQAVWGAVPSMIWAVAIALLVYWFKAEFKQLFSALVARLKSGSSIKLAGLEIGAASGLVATHGGFSNNDSQVGVYKDNGSREAHRNKLYGECRGVMLVHRLQHSTSDGQLYDVLIYLIPHKTTSFAGVSSVEYFFGSFWGDKVFPSQDRSRGFPIVTSAYGPFLCTAKVNFNDGTDVMLSRYIDFEMGNCAPQPAHES